VVLYGCETWSLTLREEQGLGGCFENRVLRRIFGPKRDDVIGKWRKLNNEELHDLYSSPRVIRIVKKRRVRWAGRRLLMRKPEGKRPLGRTTRRWLDNIRMDLVEVG
jgi:hypothetical protein